MGEESDDEFGDFGDFVSEVEEPKPVNNEDLPERLAALVAETYPPLDPVAVTSEPPSETNYTRQYRDLAHVPILNVPNWQKSVIRRKMLLQLGIPINLDELLPQSVKIKNLEMPSANSEFDIPSLKLLANISELALKSMAPEDLFSHYKKLVDAISIARTELQKVTASKAKTEAEKAAFESVIESLVDYAKRLRDNTIKQAAVPKSRSQSPST
ncbi:hypothetical protein CANCADRAFT_2298 [Tortispora caseinolytica NRRL Y-17796]|uniref:Uncharacterized protein n=1 Tax=Tortispora caseinolytica NRRL Y-17796 TaxID=767744 RepID=A0A1E4TFW6_9ASCO|nr:hypothetical protein CANCADRAFT_2298 [Tortispora caseinolytica NRRL Y-17796]